MSMWHKMMRNLGIEPSGTKPDFFNGCTIGGADISEAELKVLDGITAGTVADGKAVVPTTGKTIDEINITTLKIGTVAVTSTAAELNILDGVTADKDEINLLDGVPGLIHMAKVALGELDTPGGVLSWANPVAGSILVTGFFVDVTTASTVASTVDFGIAADGTTLSDTLIDGLDTGTGVGTYNWVDNKGDIGVGLKAIKLTQGQYITGSMASGACAGLAGQAIITYVVL